MLNLLRQNLRASLSTTAQFILGLLVVSSCAQEPKQVDRTIVGPQIGTLTVHSTSPSEDQTDVCLDHQFRIVFDDKIDAYSAIPQNFEVWTTSGIRVGGEMLVSTKFVPHPTIADREVSEVRLTFKDNLLSPNQEYYLMWGEPDADNPEVDPTAYGIQNLIGYPAEKGVIKFLTGNCRGPLRNAGFDIISASPGRILTRGKAFDSSSSLIDLINPGKEQSFVTLTKNAPVRMTFNQPIGFVPGVDPVSGVRGEIPPTPINEFPYLSAILIDADTKFDQLFASVMNFDAAAWEAFRTSYRDRLDGVVFSTNNRQTLIFQLNEGVEYPDTLAQAVVIVGREIPALQSNQRLNDDFFIVGFVHFSGFSFGSPIQFAYDELFGGSDSNSQQSSEGGQ